MNITRNGSKYWLTSKTGEIHSTSYSTPDKAAEAARKIALGLIHFNPTTAQVLRANLTNPT